jgi:hypothetical protein
MQTRQLTIADALVLGAASSLLKTGTSDFPKQRAGALL